MNRERMQRSLLRQIQAMSFAADETALYLDTHPEDKNALAAYEKYNTMLTRLTDEYNNTYGGLTRDGIKNTSKHPTWQWAGGLWPWQNPQTETEEKR